MAAKTGNDGAVDKGVGEAVEGSSRILGRFQMTLGCLEVGYKGKTDMEMTQVFILSHQWLEASFQYRKLSHHSKHGCVGGRKSQ